MLYHYIIICIVNVVGWLELFAKTRVHRTVKGEGIAVCRDKTRRFTRRAPKNPKECNDSEKAWRREMGSANRTNLRRYITLHFVTLFLCQGMSWSYSSMLTINALDLMLCFAIPQSWPSAWFLMFFPKDRKCQQRFAQTPATCILSKIPLHDKSSMSFQHIGAHGWMIISLTPLLLAQVDFLRGRSCKLCIWCQQTRLWAHHSWV